MDLRPLPPEPPHDAPGDRRDAGSADTPPGPPSDHASPAASSPTPPASPATPPTVPGALPANLPHDQIAAMAPLCAVFRRYLKSQNLKYTPERADVLNAIIEKDDVFEVDELLMEMRQQGHRVSKATIYRTIKLLQDAGIITQALFDSRQSHYQLVYGRQPRDFMVCMKTGRHIEFTDPDLVHLRNRICEKHGWDAVGHRFQIYAISPEGRAMGDDDDDATATIPDAG